MLFLFRVRMTEQIYISKSNPALREAETEWAIKQKNSNAHRKGVFRLSYYLIFNGIFAALVDKIKCQVDGYHNQVEAV